MLYMCHKGACLCPNKRIAVLIVSSNLKAFVVSPLICSSDLNQKYQVDSGVASLPTPQLFAIIYLDYSKFLGHPVPSGQTTRLLLAHKVSQTVMTTAVRQLQNFWGEILLGSFSEHCRLVPRNKNGSCSKISLTPLSSWLFCIFFFNLKIVC